MLPLLVPRQALTQGAPRLPLPTPRKTLKQAAPLCAESASLRQDGVGAILLMATDGRYPSCPGLGLERTGL